MKKLLHTSWRNVGKMILLITLNWNFGFAFGYFYGSVLGPPNTGTRLGTANTLIFLPIVILE